MNFTFQNIFIIIPWAILLVQCYSGINKHSGKDFIAETSLEDALKEWPDIPQQIIFIGLFELDQLHMTIAGGEVPDFPVIDSGQVRQTLVDGYLLVVENQLTEYGDISFHVKSNLKKGFIEIILDIQEEPVSGEIDI